MHAIIFIGFGVIKPSLAEGTMYVLVFFMFLKTITDVIMHIVEHR